MKRTARIELEELLNDSAGSDPKPDVELRDRILAEIPPALVSNTGAAKAEPIEKGSWGGWKWAAAASFVVVVGAYVAQRSSLEPAVSVDTTSPIASTAPAGEVRTPGPMLDARRNGSVPAEPAPSAPLSPEVFAREQGALAKSEARVDGFDRVEQAPQSSLEFGNESAATGGLADAAPVAEAPPAELEKKDKESLRALGYLSSQVAAPPAVAPPPPDAVHEEIDAVHEKIEITVTGESALGVPAPSAPPARATTAGNAGSTSKLAVASRRAPASSPEPAREGERDAFSDDRDGRLYRERPPVPDDVFFREYGVNPFVNPLEDAQSTFGLDVDTGSFSIARRYLADGNLPPAAAIRVEEFVQAIPVRVSAQRTLESWTGAAPARRGRADAVHRVANDRLALPLAAFRGRRSRGRLERAQAIGAHLRRRHVRIDGSRGPLGPGQALASPVVARTRPLRPGRAGDLRRSRAGGGGADE